MTTDIEGLLTQLQEATGPDRELDADILIEVFGWRRGRSETLDGYLLAPGSMEWVSNYPSPTSSLDAALTLVKDTMYAIAGPWVFAEHHPRFGQEIYDAAVADEMAGVDVECLEDFQNSGSGPTAAIALCIAALKHLKSRTHPAPGKEEEA